MQLASIDKARLLISVDRVYKHRKGATRDRKAQVVIGVTESSTDPTAGGSVWWKEHYCRDWRFWNIIT